ncbi:MAG: Mce-associated rane protein [Mycobacterium sp.]|nr:Mce-associated rane protein [Mycobacterium sp.]
MTQPHTPTAQSEEKDSAGTESVEHGTAGPDDESESTDNAERPAAEERPRIAADVTGDHSVVEDTDIEASDLNPPRRHRKRRHLAAYVVLPLLVMCMAVGAGYLKYQAGSVREAQTAAHSSVQAATDGTIALLSYRPDTVQTTLTAARDRLTGTFRDSYTSLTDDVVIPGAKEKKISATATVPGASSVVATENHAVVLVFVDQSVIVGNDAPSATASAVQVTLDKTGDRWLISGFDPK